MFKKLLYIPILLGLIVGPAFSADTVPVINPTVVGSQLNLLPTLPPNTGVVWRLKQGSSGTWYVTLGTALNNQPGMYDYIITITPANGPIPDPNPPIPPTPPIVPLVISTESLPNGVVGTSYKQTLAVSGGTTPYLTSISSAYLPKGLTLTNLDITGIPMEAGTYNFVLQIKDSKTQVITKPYTVVIAGKTPDPLPPNPTPGQLYVMIVYDPDKLDNVPLAQSSILTSKIIRDYLDTKCAKNVSGKPEWKFLSWNSKPEDIASLGKNFQKWYTESAAEAKKQNKFWITITNGKDVLSAPLMENVDKTLAELKKYGG